MSAGVEGGVRSLNLELQASHGFSIDEQRTLLILLPGTDSKIIYNAAIASTVILLYHVGLLLYLRKTLNDCM